MSAPATRSTTWHEANQRYLLAELAEVRGALERLAASPAGPATPSQPERAPVPAALREAAHAMSSPSALDTLCSIFSLSPFEGRVIVLCAGLELDSGFPALCAAAQRDPRRTYATFSLALAAFPEAHWSALTPAAPLRHWRLVELGSGESLTTSPLRLDERVLHFLAGVEHFDERLAPFVRPVPAAELVPSHRALAEHLRTTWSHAQNASLWPVVQLCGEDASGKRAIAAAAGAALGLHVYEMEAAVLPATPSECEALVRLWEREAALSGSALLLECGEIEGDAARENTVTRLVESIRSPILLSSRTRRRLRRRPGVAFDVGRPLPCEQREVWERALGDSRNSDGVVAALVTQFDLSTSAIQAACLTVPGGSREKEASPNGVAHDLWDACRLLSRPRLDGLAQRIEPAATWEMLVLPETQKRILREIAMHVRQRSRVYNDWGFASLGARGLGISALFAGASGTGKTMAAEVLANSIRLDLYRIDLSQVVSKYIGETEKNLRRVFDAAEEGGAILLFDEADALFGKRSEVKDSHDRYANIEVSYLLQRMESYRGLAILTTNMKEALDPAFLRRIRFVAEFPLPDAAQRAEIWRRIFPAGTPTENLRADLLARLNVAGGNIRNIAMSAAFLAADAGEPVRMSHLLRAARSECRKVEKALTDAEIGGWE